MPSVQIGTSQECLLLVPGSIAGAPERLVATVQLAGLQATVDVVHHYATGFQDLADFFANVEQEWRGWQGTRRWESLEGHLAIEAHHEYGHVRLTVTLRRDRSEWDNHGWRATADVTLEPGEQLSLVARDVEALAKG